MAETKFHIVLKSNEDKSKPALLYLMYTWDKRYKMSLGVSILPQWWDKDNVKIDNFSCHSLRKAFGRKVFESSGENAQMALVKLSELFNHSSVAITKIYLGLRQQELLETYDLLDF